MRREEAVEAYLRNYSSIYLRHCKNHIKLKYRRQGPNPGPTKGNLTATYFTACLFPSQCITVLRRTCHARSSDRLRNCRVFYSKRIRKVTARASSCKTWLKVFNFMNCLMMSKLSRNVRDRRTHMLVLHTWIYLCVVDIFLWLRAPQQMLQAHRSLKATLWWRWLAFSIFQVM
jgi:hypothetical protein